MSKGEVDYAVILTYVMIALLIGGFLYVAIVLERDSRERSDEDKEAQEVREELLEKLESIENKLEEIEEVAG